MPRPPGCYNKGRGRHGFDGGCRGPKACRDPPARNLVETRNANNNFVIAWDFFALNPPPAADRAFDPTT
jgi:hypothetical protein